MRLVLAEGFFDPLFESLQFGHTIREAAAMTTDVTAEGYQNFVATRGWLPWNLLGSLESLLHLFGDRPLAIRSSASGDPRGTGIFFSRYAPNRLDAVVPALCEVVASNFSPDAVLFRERTGASGAFGVILEPLIAQPIDDTGTIAPILSGMGYTSTASGPGYIRVGVGLGGGVSQRDAERISRSDLAPFQGNLGKYIFETTYEMVSGRSLARDSGLLRVTGGQPTNHWSVAVFDPEEPPNYLSTFACHKREPVMDNLHVLNLFPLFDALEALETAMGIPQYFEWALTLRVVEKFPRVVEPTFWITQIADVDPVTDALDWGTDQDIVGEALLVRGTGIRICQGIVFCEKPQDIENLRQFNAQHQGYMLVYSSILTTNDGLIRGIREGHEFHVLHVPDFSNATAVYERQDFRHNSDPEEHFGGKLRALGFFFGVLDWNISQPLFDLQRSATTDPQTGLTYYPGPVRVISREQQNRAKIAVLGK